jgi:hypothetical protein
LKLWKDSIDKLDLAARQGEAVRKSFEKYYIESSDAASEPPRLSAIYVLRDARAPFKEGFESLALPDAMRALDYEAYRPGLRAKMGQKPHMIAQGAAVFGHAKIFHFIRARGFEQMPNVVTRLLAHWDSLDG